MVCRRTARPDRRRLPRPRTPCPVARVACASCPDLDRRRSRTRIGGICLLLAGLFKLGPNLTPLPFPRRMRTLIQTRTYRLVRHPMYAGGIALAFGWALFVRGWLTLGYASVLLIFLDIQVHPRGALAHREISRLPDYQRRVRKLIRSSTESGASPAPLGAVSLGNGVGRTPVGAPRRRSTWEEHGMTARIPAYAAPTARARCVPREISRREPGPHDVRIEILFCGVATRTSTSPRRVVAGYFSRWCRHEIVGRVTRSAAPLQSSRPATSEASLLRRLLPRVRPVPPGSGAVLREGDGLHVQRNRDGSEDADVRRLFHRDRRQGAVHPEVPASLDLASAAPLLCAGSPPNSPLRRWNCKPGDRVGVVVSAPRSHGGEAGRRDGRGGDDAEHVALEGSRRAAARAHAFEPTRNRDLQEARRPVRPPDRHDLRGARPDAPPRLLRPGGAMVLLGVPRFRRRWEPWR